MQRVRPQLAPQLALAHLASTLLHDHDANFPANRAAVSRFNPLEIHRSIQLSYGRLVVNAPDVPTEGELRQGRAPSRAIQKL
jgi:hypothetical protein